MIFSKKLWKLLVCLTLFSLYLCYSSMIGGHCGSSIGWMHLVAKMGLVCFILGQEMTDWDWFTFGTLEQTNGIGSLFRLVPSITSVVRSKSSGICSRENGAQNDEESDGTRVQKIIVVWNMNWRKVERVPLAGGFHLGKHFWSISHSWDDFLTFEGQQRLLFAYLPTKFLSI